MIDQDASMIRGKARCSPVLHGQIASLLESG